MIRAGGKASSILVVGCLLAITGCAKSERNLPTDPLVEPFVVPVSNAEFNPTDGSIHMEWRHYGRSVRRFRIRRTEYNPPNEDVQDWIDVNSVAGASSDVQPALSYADTAARAGERYDYAVETTENLILVGPVALGGVTIPGATIQSIDLRFADASATIAWEAVGALPITGVDVFRRADGGPSELRFQTSPLDGRTLQDGGLEAGRRYAYFLRTRFQNDLELESATVPRGFFLPGQQTDFVTGTPEHIRLTSHPQLTNLALPNLGSFLRLHASPSGSLLISRFSDDGSIYGFEGTLRNTGSTSPASLSLAIQHTGAAQVVIASIGSGQVRIEAYAIPNAQRLDPFGMPAIAPIAMPAPDWPVPQGATRTALTISDAGFIYAAAGSRLRVITPDLDVIGDLDLNTPSPVTGLAASGSGDLWAVLGATGTVLRSLPLLVDGSLRPPVWESVDLPSGGRAGAVTFNGVDGFFVLDEASGRVLGYDLTGTRVMEWDGLTALDLSAGPNGIVNSRGSVYVWDSKGTAMEFRNEE